VTAEIRAYLAPLGDVLMALQEPLGASQAQAETRAERLVMETNIEPAQAVEMLRILFPAASNPCLLYPTTPELYECAACSGKPGSPTLCGRCLDARAKAGNSWLGQQPRQPTKY